MTKIENSIDEVNIKISSEASSASSNLDQLANSITNLESKITSAISKMSGFNDTLKKLTNLTSGKNIENSVFGNIQKSMASMNQTAKNNNLSSLMKSLNNIPDISKKLDEKEIATFTKKINELTLALSPLANQLVKVSSSFALLPTNLSKVNTALNKTKNSIKNVQSSLSDKVLSNLSSGLRFGVLVAGIKGVTSTIGNFVNSSNEYIENMNLFKVSMGEMADEAQDFIDKFSGALGVDPSGLMRYMGLFNNLIEGFGIGSEEAYTMSKNLTQLSYDMSSYLNIPIDEAMQKLKSGIAGEIKPMRAVGVALDQATLQETAYALGINKRVSEMTRAQKTELLYYQIMQKTKNMQGDMGRTILQPANALRVLQQQFTQLGRAIGNIFIPILTALIPYIMVLTQWLTTLAQSIANFFDFEIQEPDYSSISSGLGGVSDSIGDVGGSADTATKKLNRMLAKFDELNVIEFDTGTGSGGGSGSGGGASGGSLGIPLYDYDAITGKFNEQLDEVEKKLKNILPYVESVGLSFLAWKVSSSVLKFLDKLGLIKNLSSALRIAAGVSIAIGGAWLIYEGIKQAIEEGELNADSILKLIAGGTLVSSGLGLAFKSTVPLKLGIGLTLVITLASSMVSWWNEYFEERKKELYGDKKELNLGEMLYVGFGAMGEGVTEDFIKPLIGEENWDKYIDNVSNRLKIVKNLFNPEMWEIVFDRWKLIWEIGWQNIVDWWNNTAVGKWWNDNVAPWFTSERWEKGLEGIKIGFELGWQAVVNWWNNLAIVKWWNDNVAPWFTKEKWQELFNNIKTSLSNKWNEIVKWWKEDGLKKWWNDNVAPWFTKEKWQELFNNIKTSLSNKWNEIVKWWKEGGLKKWWNENVAPWFTTKKWKDLVKNAIDAIKNSFSNLDIKLKLPHFSWTTQPASGWVADILSALNLPTSLPKLNVSWYAEGGLPDAGEVFVAREAGPELVGSIGNRAAVANNDQIIEGIKQGTYEAVSTAMRENNNSRQPVIVKIGEKTIYSGYGSYVDSQSNMYGTNYIRT